MYSPAVLPSTGSPIAISQAFVFGSPLRWQGTESNPMVCWTVLPPLTAWPFGSSVVWV